MRLDLLLLVFVVCAASALADGPSFNQINFEAGPGQKAGIQLKSGDEAYEIVASDGKLDINYGEGNVLSVSPDGQISSGADLFAVDKLIAGSLFISGVPQFNLFYDERFYLDNPQSNANAPTKRGWNSNVGFVCQGQHILTGVKTSVKGPASRDPPTLTKTYKKLDKHTQVRIQIDGRFIDNWQGESIGVRVDGNVIFSAGHKQIDSGNRVMNLCGNPNFGEGQFLMPIDVTVPHNSPELKLEIFTTLEYSDDAHFGISRVAIMLRNTEP